MGILKKCLLFAFYALLVIASPAICILLGYIMLYSILREQKSPADNSNRINKIRLVWFAMTRENLFIPLFTWLRNDELDNVRGAE